MAQAKIEDVSTQLQTAEFGKSAHYFVFYDGCFSIQRTCGHLNLRTEYLLFPDGGSAI